VDLLEGKEHNMERRERETEGRERRIKGGEEMKKTKYHHRALLFLTSSPGCSKLF